MADPITPQHIEAPPVPQGQRPAERVDVGMENDTEMRVEQIEATEPTTVPERTVESSATSVVAPTPSKKQAVQPMVKDHVSRGVEKILEEDLGELYASLDPAAKVKFRERGESVALEISEMVRTLKVRVARIVRLIRDWLLMIPKVNKHFLEQEAKIKTDEIITFANDLKEHPPETP